MARSPNALLRLVLAAQPGAQAIASGTVLVQMQLPGSPEPTRSQLPIPPFTPFETPDANLHYAGATGSMHGVARAAGDLESGFVNGAFWTQADVEVPGGSGFSPYAKVEITYDETLDIASDVLPAGSPVTVEVRALTSWLGSLGVDNGWAQSRLYAYSEASVPGTLEYDESGFLAPAVGASMHALDPLVLDAEVGDTVRLQFILQIYAQMQVTATYVAPLIDAGHGEAQTVALLAFGAEATPALAMAARAAGPETLDAPLVTLRSQTFGGAFPGFEALLPESYEPHMPSIPEPGTGALAAAGLLAIGLHCRARRRPRPHA